MSPQELDAAWSALVQRVSALGASAAALVPQTFYKAFGTWYSAYGTGKVTPANISDWLNIYNAQLALVTQIEQASPAPLSSLLMIGAASLGGLYFILRDTPPKYARRRRAR